ncbi:hypothetical protein HJFPF1_08810 [Paramyrothecium foliicola]|nr:hypothetical protein HJFPF1_08810 [Paramyrothecium foliicola]
MSHSSLSRVQAEAAEEEEKKRKKEEKGEKALGHLSYATEIQKAGVLLEFHEPRGIFPCKEPSRGTQPNRRTPRMGFPFADQHPIQTAIPAINGGTDLAGEPKEGVEDWGLAGARTHSPLGFPWVVPNYAPHAANALGFHRNGTSPFVETVGPATGQLPELPGLVLISRVVSSSDRLSWASIVRGAFRSAWWS